MEIKTNEFRQYSNLITQVMKSSTSSNFQHQSHIPSPQQSQHKQQQWHRICNMRSTLLQLQYLYCSISSDLEQQQQHTTLMHRDRLLQIRELAQNMETLRKSNFRVMVIVKLEAVLDKYARVDQMLWNNIDKFVKCVQYLEQQMSRDVGRVYIGANVMLDLHKCESALKQVEVKITSYIQQNKQSIKEYNEGIKQVRELEDVWKQYMSEIMTTVKDKIEPYYSRYLRNRLQAREKQLQSSIKALKQFITS